MIKIAISSDVHANRIEAIEFTRKDIGEANKQFLALLPAEIRRISPISGNWMMRGTKSSLIADRLEEPRRISLWPLT